MFTSICVFQPSNYTKQKLTKTDAGLTPELAPLGVAGTTDKGCAGVDTGIT